jgi:hypothetical protein
MTSKFRGEEKIRYLIVDSPCPVIDSVLQTIQREEKRRQVDGIQPIEGPIYLNMTIFRGLLLELREVNPEEAKALPYDNGKFYFQGYWFCPFFETRLSAEARPDVQYIMIIDSITKEIRGL